MFKSKLTLTKLLITIILTLGLSISFQSLLADWAAPTVAPPEDNLGQPIDTSASTQTKDGNLGILGNFTVTGDGTGQAYVGSFACGSDYTGISFNGRFDCGNYNILSHPTLTEQHLYINRPNNHEIRFREDNNDQVVIQSGGNVGIGQSNPEYSLHVRNNHGVMLAGGLDTWADNVIIETGWEAARGDWLNLTVPSGDDESGFMTLLSNGNVGIGTNVPNTKLHVAGPILSEGGSYSARSGAGTDSKTNAAMVIDRGDAVYFETNGYLRNLMDVDASGNIDIGQSGTSLVPSVNLLAGSAGFITLVPGGGEAVRVLSNGNVGIGVAAPTKLLEVDGDAGYQDIGDMGSSDTDFASKKYVDDSGMPPYVAGDFVEADSGLHTTTVVAWVKKYEVEMQRSGTVRIRMGLRSLNLAWGVVGRILLNGVATGIHNTSFAGAWAYYTHDLAVSKGDTIEFWMAPNTVVMSQEGKVEIGIDNPAVIRQYFSF